LKSTTKNKNGELWISGSNTHMNIFKKIRIILKILFFYENIVPQTPLIGTFDFTK